MLDDQQPRLLSEDALWSRAEDLLDRFAPKIYGNILASGIRQHGFKALLAIFETALLAQCGHVQRGHGYLTGILRKPPDECNPDLTLSRLLAARRMPGFMADSSRQEQYDRKSAAASIDRMRLLRSMPPAPPSVG